MPLYAWKCRVCGTVADSSRRDLPPSCPSCLTPMTRDYSSIQFGSHGLQPHFNHALGTYVTSNRDFDDKLKAAGEAAGTTYSRLDPGDQPRPTQDDHAFDDQARAWRDQKITVDEYGRKQQL